MLKNTEHTSDMTPSPEPIRVAPGKRYFETFSGAPFLFIGMNDAISWPGLAGLHERRDLPSVDAYLRQIASSGITVLRLMLEYAQIGWYFEQSPGRFNPVMVQLWDDLIERCAHFGLRILLTPWDTFWMSRRWKDHPYNRINGGLAIGASDFLTNEAVIQAWINRLAFVVERWGKSGVIAAWDLFNEIHPYWGGTVEQQSQTISRVSTALREVELSVAGFTRPQTVSCFGPNPPLEYESLIFKHPQLDFATTHVYFKENIDNPKDTVAPAVEMSEWVRYGLTRAEQRPFTDSEHGPIFLFNNRYTMLQEAFDDEYERHMMWAHLASGGAGSGLRWPARNPHILTPGMQRALHSLAVFTRLIQWRHFTPQPFEERLVSPNGEFRVFGSADSTQAVLWLLRASAAPRKPRARRRVLPMQESSHNLELTLLGFEEGIYSVTLWNTREGCIEASYQVTVATDRQLRLHIPTIWNDLALAVQPI